jgi:hypothetical protein
MKKIALLRDGKPTDPDSRSGVSRWLFQKDFGGFHHRSAKALMQFF